MAKTTEIQYNKRSTFDPTKDIKGEKDFGPSKTIPDMTLSVEQLIKRHLRGEEVATYSGIYLLKNEEDFTGIIPSWETMSRIERVEYARELTQYIKNKRTELGQIHQQKLRSKKAKEDMKRHIQERDNSQTSS